MGKEKKERKYRDGICENEKCAKFRRLHKSKHSGKYVCVLCQRNDPYYHKHCSGCKKLKKIVMRIVRNHYDNVCHSCGKKSHDNDRICRFCFSDKPVVDCVKEFFCQGCYINHPYRKGLCVICKKEKPVFTRNENDEPICLNCNRNDVSKHQNCSQCGALKQVYTRDEADKPICRNCHRNNPKNHEVCSKCKQLKLVYTRDKFGNFVCRSVHCRRKAAREDASRDYGDENGEVA